MTCQHVVKLIILENIYSLYVSTTKPIFSLG